MLAPGKYTATATAIRFVKPKDILGIQVLFKVKLEGEAFDKIDWTGWTSYKATEQTLKTLQDVLEWNLDDRQLNVPKDDPRFGMLLDQDCINRKKEVELVIEHEEYTDQKGEVRTRARVRWVNLVGGSQFAGCAPEVVQADLSASGFKAAALARKQGLPPMAQAAPAPAAMDDSFPSDPAGKLLF